MAAKGGFDAVANVSGAVEVEDVRFRLDAFAFEVFFAYVGRCEERKALDVIPVGVGEKDVGLTFALPEFLLHHFISQYPDAGTGIENDPSVFRTYDFDAGGIATKFDGVFARYRNRSSYTPEFYYHTSTTFRVLLQAHRNH